jgi:PAS domain S-box-containing protein
LIEWDGVSDAASGRVDFHAVFEALPTACLLMSPDLVIVEANDAYLRLLGCTRAQLVGRPVFEAFPPAPEMLDEQGRNPLQVFFERARDSGLPDRMQLVRYDVVDGETGSPAHRYWSLISAPISVAAGRAVLLLLCVEDVTDSVVERHDRETELVRSESWQRRAEVVEGELSSRAQDLRQALEAREKSARRLAGLADAALQLAAAASIEELAEIVVSAGLTAIGVDGGAIGVRDDAAGLLRLTVTDSLGETLRAKFPELLLNDPLPSAVAARTGEVVLLKDREAAVAFAPGMTDLYAATGREAWAALPLRVGDRLLGSLTASWAKPHVFDSEEVGLLGAFAAQCGQSLARLQVREAEQRIASISRRMSETLQRSLLTAPPKPDHLEIVVRYRSAAEQVQIGGDWYDAFMFSDGAVCLVVGDVTGHDGESASFMGQVRNLMRGIGYIIGEPPGAVLGAVDRALRDLEVGTLATAVLARVEQAPAQAAGARLLRWANAGHPPPLLLRADGSTMLLEHAPDLLLGYAPGTARTDHSHDLGAGDSVLLYTDGLVERRGADLDDGLTWLLSAVAGRAHLTPAELADSLLAEVQGFAEDDIALLLLRAHPEDRPRAATSVDLLNATD